MGLPQQRRNCLDLLCELQAGMQQQLDEEDRKPWCLNNSFHPAQERNKHLLRLPHVKHYGNDRQRPQQDAAAINDAAHLRTV